MLGTSRRMSSVTRDPFKLRMQRSSRFFKRLLSDNSRSSGIRASDNRAHTKSIYKCQLVSLFWLMAKVDLMNWSDTHWYSRKVHGYDGYVSIDDGLLGSRSCWAIVKKGWLKNKCRLTVISVTSFCSLSISYMVVKNSSRSTCRGNTDKQSISEPRELPLGWTQGILESRNEKSYQHYALQGDNYHMWRFCLLLLVLAIREILSFCSLGIRILWLECSISQEQPH